MILHLDVQYQNAKEFYTDKTPSRKYIITIQGDQANFAVRYTSHDKKFTVRYSYPDYELKRKPTKAEMEQEIMNALAAVNRKGRQQKLKLENY